MLEVNVASTGRRIFAYLIDSLIASLFMIPVLIQLAGARLSEGQLAVDLNLLLVCSLVVIFYRWLFLYFLGGTLGKLIMRLRVVPAHDVSANLGLMQSLIRVLTDGLSIFFGHAPRALALLRFDRTQLADWVAETRVVQLQPRKRIPVRRPLLASLIVLVSGVQSFTEIYTTVQSAEIVSGKITFVLDSDVHE